MMIMQVRRTEGMHLYRVPVSVVLYVYEKLIGTRLDSVQVERCSHEDSLCSLLIMCTPMHGAIPDFAGRPY
jgi:hypothetical protein